MTESRCPFSHLKPRYLSISRTLGYVFTLSSDNAWWGLFPVFKARLSLEERAAIAFMALKALNQDDAMRVVEAALCAGVGQPQSPLFSLMDEATRWAELAEPKELEAYCLATFEAMPRNRQAAFLDYVQGSKRHETRPSRFNTQYDALGY